MLVKESLGMSNCRWENKKHHLRLIQPIEIGKPKTLKLYLGYFSPWNSLFPGHLYIPKPQKIYGTEWLLLNHKRKNKQEFMSSKWKFQNSNKTNRPLETTSLPYGICRKELSHYQPPTSGKWREYIEHQHIYDLLRGLNP